MIIALGSVNVDIQVRVERWPDPGETLFTRDFMLLGGGKAANVAYFARRVGLPAALIAHVGDDLFGPVALERLAEAEVDLSQTRRVAGAATGVATISVRPDGNKTILMADNANASWNAADAHDTVEAIASAPDGSVLVVDLEIPLFVVEQAAEAARQRGFRIVLDPSPAERMTAALYPFADALTPNRSEAAQLLQGATPGEAREEEITSTLLARGARNVLLKLGAQCLLAGPGPVQRLRSLDADAVDTTGAGDAFAAALAIGFLEGRDIREAALLALAGSSLAIEAYGSQPSYPDREQLDARFRQLVAMNAS